MVRIAGASLAAGAPSAHEILEQEREFQLTRRRFLLATGGTILGVAAVGGCEAPARDGARKGGASSAKAKRGGQRVAIVGAGLAGLTAAYELRKVGIEAAIYESSARVGGRVFTARDIMAAGLTTELGGEFIDSTHADVLSVVGELGLELIDTKGPDEVEYADTYYFSHCYRDDAEILDALVPIVARMREDFAALPETIDHQTRSTKAVELDHLSLTQYFDRVGATGFVRDLLAIAYTTEYGLDPGEQSPLNLLSLFDLEPRTDSSTQMRKFEPYGDSDERFKMRGGNQRITEELARRVEGTVRVEHRLESVTPSGDGYSLSFARESAGSVEVRADVLLLTLPFSRLREVELRIDLSAVKRKAIAELGYGQGAKLLMPFNQRIWRERKRSGSFFTDAGPQSGWDNSRGQPGDAGGLTVFTGGDKSGELERDSAHVASLRAIPALMKIFPNANLAFVGRAERFHWPSHPHTRGSYACYRPGQWTSIAGAEASSVGNVYFAGEHCSREFQGFMNGAVETGRGAVREILQTVGVRGGGV